MITEDELRLLQVRFEPKRQSYQAHVHELEKRRREFASKFPPSRIPLLSLDDYVEGKGSKDSFCYWVEWTTSELGNIKGPNASKFGVFFDKDTQRYAFTARFQNENAAIKFLRQQIIRLLEAGSVNDLETIRQIEISPMFKGKILFLYYPDQFLNIFSEAYVDYFLREAGLAVPSDNIDVLAKRELLLKFKAGDEVMSKWTTYEFNYFLYETWGEPPRASKLPAVLQKYVEARSFPSAESTRGEFISFELVNARGSSGQEGRKRDNAEIDFEEQNRRNKRIGDQGEEVVYRAERRWLEDNGRRDLAQKVELVCRQDAGAGYDLSSFELDGMPKYIEVKATTSRPPAQGGSVRFHFSAGEFEQAKGLSNYYLFVVFDVKSVNPKIWRIRHPANLAPGLLLLQPSAYHAILAAGSPKEVDDNGK